MELRDESSWPVTLAGTSSKYNVGASVNHPLFVLWYVKDALPYLMELEDYEWADEYQQGSFCAYLRHHRALLEEQGLWQQHAEAFLQRHS